MAFRNGLGHSLYADSHATGNITTEDVRDLHARAVSNLSNVAVLGTGISTESLAKLFETVFSAHKASAATPTLSAVPAPATAYHGSTTRVASTHGPQVVFIGFGSTASASVPALHAPAAHLNPAPALKWAGSSAPVASAIPAGIKARCVLLPYSDATAIGVVLEGKDAAAGKVSKEELARTVARAKFQLAAGIEAREGYVGLLDPRCSRVRWRACRGR